MVSPLPIQHHEHLQSSYLSVPLTGATSSSVLALLTSSNGLESGRLVDRSLFVLLRGEKIVGNVNKRQIVFFFSPSSIDFCFSQMVCVRTNIQTNQSEQSERFVLLIFFPPLVQGSTLPLSIIIVGVGPAEFDGECFVSVSRRLLPPLPPSASR